MEVISDDVHLRQKISVPFLWEETPGKPKTVTNCTFTCSPPPSNNIKNVGASVPFGWEEEPGKPLVQFRNLPSSDDDLEEKEMYKSYLETFLFQTQNGSSTVKENENTEISMTKFIFPLDAKGGGFLKMARFIQDEGDQNLNVRRRSMTLGELILLSRRLSCEKESVILHEHDRHKSFTKDFMKLVSACMF